jgi:predicted Ser/Thr protein kinase
MKRENLRNSVPFSKGNIFGKPDLSLVKAEGRTLMVKDVREKPFIFRWTLGLWLIRKEWKIYLRLKGIQGIPDGVVRIDRFAFAMEFVEGRPIERQETLAPAFFPDLERMLKEIHGRGVVHLDLRHKGNILVSEEGKPYLIDFNSSISFREKGFLRRFLFPLLRWVDYGGFLKLKERVSLSLLTPEEIAFLRKLRRLRKLWIFN